MKLTNLKVPKFLGKFGTKLAVAATEHGPQVAVTVGIVGTVVAVVYAAHQTTKLSGRLDEAKTIIEDAKKESRQMEQPKATLCQIGGYIRGVRRVGGLYLGPAIVLAVSDGMILWAFHELDGRLAAVTGALIATQAENERGWKELAGVVGEDKARDIRYDMHTEDKVVALSENEEVQVKEKVANDPNDIRAGVYEILWAEETVKRSFWKDDPWWNYTRLCQVQDECNRELREHGFIFLNDVLKRIGIRSLPKIGNFVGWIDNGTNDRQIDFGLDLPKARPLAALHEPNAMLTFNCTYIMNRIDCITWGRIDE